MINQKYNTLVLEDDPIDQDLIQILISKTPDLQLIEICSTVAEAINYLLEGEIDLFISDIHLPDQNGLDLIRSLPKRPLIILSSSYPEYAVQGFELNVLDYWVKPVTFDRFLQGIQRVRQQFELHQMSIPQKQDYFFVKSDLKFVKLFFEEVNYISAEKDYIKIHTDKKIWMVNLPTKVIEKQLPTEYFIRIHRSYLVNISKIDSFNSISVFVGEDELPLGMSYREQVTAELLKNRFLHR